MRGVGTIREILLSSPYSARRSFPTRVSVKPCRWKMYQPIENSRRRTTPSTRITATAVMPPTIGLPASVLIHSRPLPTYPWA